jgi:hypothetical protein
MDGSAADYWLISRPAMKSIDLDRENDEMLTFQWAAG